MEQIRVLLLTTDESLKNAALPENICLEISSADLCPEQSDYELVILDRTPTEKECACLQKVTRAHTLFFTPQVDREQCREYCMSKLAFPLGDRTVEEFLRQDAHWFFHDSYGEKYHPDQMAVSPDFTGDVCWKGSYALQLSGDFGQTMSQAVFWRNNIPIQPGQTIDFWLEYAKTPGIELSFRAIQFAAGSRCDIIGTWEFSGERMDEIMSIRAEEKSFLFVSLSARGSGTLEVIALHDRHSRGPYGHFMPGGERFLTSRREEIFCYFDPGDRKPPLNVYFSGYKTREGFEGYNLMRGMGGPFLLISDSRLEGGAFYIGSEEYEALMTSVLRKYMQELGFGEQDVILSGISMGSTGALYYGCDIRPHAVVVGKPLANLGTIAANEKLIRPGGFPTSLDLLLTREGDLSRESVARLDERFWRKFRAADWSDTKLIVSYMLEDDYDRCAYEQMVEALSTGSASIYGRGLHGRHNDNTGGIVQWFASEYKRLLQDDFAQYQSETRREMMK